MSVDEAPEGEEETPVEDIYGVVCKFGLKTDAQRREGEETERRAAEMAHAAPLADCSRLERRPRARAGGALLALLPDA